MNQGNVTIILYRDSYHFVKEHGWTLLEVEDEVFSEVGTVGGLFDAGVFVILPDLHLDDGVHV